MLFKGFTQSLALLACAIILSACSSVQPTATTSTGTGGSASSSVSSSSGSSTASSSSSSSSTGKMLLDAGK